MNHQSGLTRKLALGLAVAITLDTVGQLLWKWAVGALPSSDTLLPSVEAVLAQPIFLVVAAVFLAQLFNWLKVLEHADLSFAQPITSLAYVAVTGLSWLLFAEPVGWLKVVGIVCILAGVWLIGGGRRITAARTEPKS